MWVAEVASSYSSSDSSPSSRFSALDKDKAESSLHRFIQAKLELKAGGYPHNALTHVLMYSSQACMETSYPFVALTHLSLVSTPFLADLQLQLLHLGLTVAERNEPSPETISFGGS